MPFSKPVRSKAFGNFDLSKSVTERVRGDLKTVLELDEKIQEGIIEILPGFLLSQLHSEDDALVEEFVKKFKIEERSVRTSLRVFGFLARQLMDDEGGVKDDPPQIVSEDICSLGLIDEKNIERITPLIAKVKDVTANEIAGKLYERQFSGGVFPAFAGVEYAADLRLVPNNRFSVGSNPDLYVPEVKAMVPVVSLKIALRNADTEGIAVQMTKVDVERTIDMLKAALRDVVLLEGVEVDQEDHQK